MVIAKDLCKTLGITHLRTTAYHPQANGMIERFHRTLKAAITCTGANWSTNLPTILLAMRNTVKEDLDLQTTPGELVYGEALRLPGEFFTDTPATEPTSVVSDLRQVIKKLRPTPGTNHDTRSKLFVYHYIPDHTKYLNQTTKSLKFSSTTSQSTRLSTV